MYQREAAKARVAGKAGAIAEDTAEDTSDPAVTRDADAAPTLPNAADSMELKNLTRAFTRQIRDVDFQGARDMMAGAVDAGLDGCPQDLPAGVRVQDASTPKRRDT